MVDCIVKPFDASQRGASRTSMPGKAKVSHGGVGRNMAEVIARLGGFPSLFSAVGNDEAGEQLIRAAQKLGIGVDSVARIGRSRTATFTALLDGSGELVGAVADMDVFEKVIPANLQDFAGLFSHIDLVVCDANLPTETMEEILVQCSSAQVHAWFEPVSVAKAPRGRCSHPWHLMSPNWDELLSLLGHAPCGLPESCSAIPSVVIRTLEEALSLAVADNVLLTMGPAGAVLASVSHAASPDAAPNGPCRLAVDELLTGVDGAPRGVPDLVVQVESLPLRQGRCFWYRLLQPLTSVCDTTGAGDALIAGTACAHAGGWPLEDAVIAGLLCAHLTLFVDGAVASFFNPGLLSRLRHAVHLGGEGAATLSRL